MRPENLFDAMDFLDNSYLSEAEQYTREKNMQNKKTTKTSYRAVLSIAAAVALLLALGITAYAIDLFGFKALLTQETTLILGEEYSGVSLTQPQAAPEGLAPDIDERVSKSQIAWDEWEKWLEDNSPQRAMKDEMPEVFQIDAYAYNIIENPDGSYTLEILAQDLVTIVETRQATAEEYGKFIEIMERYAKNPSGYNSRYDFNYRSNSAEADEALKRIADKYGLALREKMQVEIGDDPLTPAQLSEKTAEIGNAGNIFRVTPPFFDKIYWYNEGSYCISYNNMLSSGETAYCYGYNSMYGTLSSGEEVVNFEQDVSSFNERSYTTADGTTVTILSNDNTAYLYVYLENSFFAMKISCSNTLSDSDINTIADGLNYSLMGR